MKSKMKIDPADYIDFVQMLVAKYAGPYRGMHSWDEILSHAYEAMLAACRSYDGAIPLKSWITLKVRKSFPQLSRDVDVAKRYQRARSDFIEPVFIDIDEVTLSTNGHEIQRMIDRQHIRFLVERACLSETKKRRLNLRFFEGYKLREIGEMEGVGESAVSLSIIESFKRMRSVSRRRKLSDAW